MFEVLLVVYLIIALALVGLILIQQGKGADMGASFGAGASNTMFGSSGAGNFLTRTTAVLATLFFLLSIILGSMSTQQTKQTDEWENLEVPASEQPVGDVPATDVPASDVPASEENSGDVPN